MYGSSALRPIPYGEQILRLSNNDHPFMLLVKIYLTKFDGPAKKARKQKNGIIMELWNALIMRNR